MREFRPGTVIAVVALFIAIGGTATAASGLINGNKIKPGTISARQIKNKAITKAKLAPATVKSLRGARGPAGPAGATGPAGAPGATGATGATGPAAMVDPISADVTVFNLPFDEFVVPLSLELPSGRYLLSAKTNVVNHESSGDNMIDCTIWTDEVDGVDRAVSDVPYNSHFNLSMVAVADVEELVELRCIAWDGNAQLSNVKLIAEPVQG
jgi:hypothetical protein